MNTFFEAVINFILAIILPVGVYLLIIGGLMFVDTLLGLYRVKKNKEKFIWSKFFKGLITKMYVYTPIIVCVYWMDFHLLNDIVKLFINVDLLFTKLASLILSSTEITSINKNFKAVTGKSLLDRLRNVVKVAHSVKNEINDFSKDSEKGKEKDEII